MLELFIGKLTHMFKVLTSSVCLISVGCQNTCAWLQNKMRLADVLGT